MDLSRYVPEFEMECEDRDDPAIDAGRWSCIWVIQHPPDIPCIYFNNQVSDSDYEDLICSEGAEESI